MESLFEIFISREASTEWFALRIIVQPREKENIVFLNSLLPPLKRSLTVKCPLRAIEEKKTNEKFLPRTILTLLTPLKNFNPREYSYEIFLNIHHHPSIHSWDRLKIFLNAISFTRFAILHLHFNSYFAPQFRVNILYATGIDANESDEHPQLPPVMRYFYARFCYARSYSSSFPLLLTVNFSKNRFAHLCESSFF